MRGSYIGKKMRIDPAGTMIPKESMPLKKSGFHMVRDQNDRMAGSMPVLGPVLGTDDLAAKIADTSTAPDSPSTALGLASADADAPAPSQARSSDFGFKDFLDIINPLQHIPIVSTIYEHLTGDKMGAAASIIGGGIYGGPIGAAAGAATAVVKTALQGEPDTPEVKADEFARVLQSVAHDVTNTTIAYADLRKGYTPYNS